MKNRFRILLPVAVAVVLVSYETTAQYYYKDIVTLSQNQAQYKLLKGNKVTKVKLLSFESDGAPTEDFQCEQSFNNSFSQLKTVTTVPITGASTLINYYNFQGQLYRSVDSSKESITVYEYQYDSTGKLAVINSASNAMGEKQKAYESHYWVYSANGKPEKMWKVKDKLDSIEVKIRLDDKGNVSEEESFRKNIPLEKIYYYYDSLGRMTDIVRYNDQARKLLPDYLFDYGEAAELRQMITVQNAGLDYLTWRYEYNDKGLKIKESCYNKKRQLAGRIEYQYEYRR